MSPISTDLHRSLFAFRVSPTSAPYHVVPVAVLCARLLTHFGGDLLCGRALINRAAVGVDRCIIGVLFVVDVRLVVLPLAQITATWLLACAHGRTGRNPLLVAGILLNLASLATFKYLAFALGTIEAVVGFPLPRTHIVLPIGISFLSFQLISYLGDRTRGDAPIYSFRPFALFVLLYPHLIAGPIVRHNELVPQFDRDPLREGLWTRIGIGLIIFTIGFAKKVLLADKLAIVADPLFTQATYRALDLGEAWTAVLHFSFQLFLDFSAYTE